ncbi:hypothetical protein [Candidatus Uabimicrobium sp. HlEnr_7]|uniref:hypothetical protein n=1 Tax=Candidatus Uabimicrobium helgolandensis TaxID=3095367 RepID=UPI0035591C7C
MKHFYKNTKNFRKNTEALSSYIIHQRWYRGKSQSNHNISIDDVIEIANEQYIFIVTANNSIKHKYILFLILSEQKQQNSMFNLYIDNKQLFVYDGCQNEEYCNNLWNIIQFPDTYRNLSSFIIHQNLDLSINNSKLQDIEQSNTNIIYDDRLLLKIFRQPQPGTNPDLEINVFLSEQGFCHVPKTVAAIRYTSDSGKIFDIAIVQELVKNAKDCWEHTVDLASKFLVQNREENLAQRSIFSSLKTIPSTMELSANFAKLLGQRTAELHLALTNTNDNADFTPSKIDNLYLLNLYKGFCGILQEVVDTLENSDMRTNHNVIKFLEAKNYLQTHFESLTTIKTEGFRIRCHGDYHLGQILKLETDIVILDFEGEPLRPIEERRQKQSPFKDVAGMIRSFNYAGFKAAMDLGTTDISRANYWGNIVSTTFLSEYLKVAESGKFLSQNKQQQRVLLQLFLFDKALYELKYELNNRPDWVHIPLSGIISLLNDVIEK